MDEKEMLIKKSKLAKEIEHIYNDIELKIICFKREFVCHHVVNPALYARSVWQDWEKFKKLYQEYTDFGDVRFDFSNDRGYQIEIEDNLVSHIDKKIEDMYLDLLYDVRGLLFNAIWKKYEYYEVRNAYIDMVSDDYVPDIENPAKNLVLDFASFEGIDCLSDADFKPC